jgi:hypothetical protein
VHSYAKFERDVTVFAASKSGIVVGGRLTPDDKSVPFEWRDGEVKQLPRPKEAWVCEATTVSGDGRLIAGYYVRGRGFKDQAKPVLWYRSSLVTLKLPKFVGAAKPHRASYTGNYIAGLIEGGPLSPAGGIPQRQSFIVHEGSMRVLPNRFRGSNLKALQLTVLGVNTHGFAVGKALFALGINNLKERAFYWNGKENILLSDPTYIITAAVGISESGHVFCSAEKDGVKYLYVARV